MKIKKNSRKNKKASKKNRKGAEEFCLCCCLQAKIRHIVVVGHEPQPIDAARLLYLVMSEEPNLCVPFELFDLALFALEDRGVIENDGGQIKLANGWDSQSQMRLVN